MGLAQAASLLIRRAVWAELQLASWVLQAVSSLLLGAAKLQRAIKVAAREAEATGYQGLAPVTSTFKVSWIGYGCVAGDAALYLPWLRSGGLPGLRGGALAIVPALLCLHGGSY